MTFPFIVQEVTGPRRAVILEDRALPYRPVTWGGTHRVNVVYSPGNPVAMSQATGPTFTNTTIRGKWKDRYLFDPATAPKIFGFPKISPAGGAGDLTIQGGQSFLSGPGLPATQAARRARVLRDAFTLIRKSGQLLKVEWGSLVRYGHLVTDSYEHDQEEQIGFDLEFRWTGDTANQPIIKLPGFDALSLLQKLFALLDRVLNALLKALFNAQRFVLRITSIINRIGFFARTLLEILEKFAELAFAPADILATARANLTAIKLAARDLFATMDAASAAVEAGLPGNAAILASAVRFEKSLRDETHRLAASAAEDALEISRLLSRKLLGVVVVQGLGTRLTDISTKFYGTPDNWNILARFNGLSGSRVPRGTVIRVPDISSGAAL